MNTIVLLDRNHQKVLKKITNTPYFFYNTGNSEIHLRSLVLALLYKFLWFKESLRVLYYYVEIKNLAPKIIISFQDTNLNVLRLSRLFRNVKFIIVQNSFRPPGFYGSIKLKKTDVFFKYSPIVDFNLCDNEISIKTYKYYGQKSNFKISGSVIFISQFRNYSNEKLKSVTKNYLAQTPNIKLKEKFNHLEYQEKYLKFLSSNFSKEADNFFYKSAYRDGIGFKKQEESNYFKRYNISEIDCSTIDIIMSDDNNIFLTIDSTMIFELLSHGKKVLIYPYRDIFMNLDMKPHMKIMEQKFPFLFISKDLKDFNLKYHNLLNKNQIDYEKEISLFMDLKELSLDSLQI